MPVLSFTLIVGGVGGRSPSYVNEVALDALISADYRQEEDRAGRRQRKKI